MNCAQASINFSRTGVCFGGANVDAGASGLEQWETEYFVIALIDF